MTEHQQPPGGPDRSGQVTTALRLVWISVVFGIVSGAGCRPGRPGIDPEGEFA